MKWAIGGLFVLGIVAACCAALLVNALRASAVVSIVGGQDPSAPTTPSEVDVLVADRSLPAMTVVDGSVVSIKSMPREKAPAGYISDSVEVVGRVLRAPIVQGQAFTARFFTNETSPHQLAAVIPPGKRAVAISVSDFAGLEGMLYPGSVVDVLLSLKSDANDGASQSVATTLLEGVQVLAVERQTVVAPAQTINEFMDDSAHSGAARVTLLVDTRQAKALQLAMQLGTLSLALRNPLDSSVGDHETVSLRSILGGTRPFFPAPAVPDVSVEPSWASDMRKMMTQMQIQRREAQLTPAPKPAPAPHWDVTVQRGKDVEVDSFETGAISTAMSRIK